MSEKPSLEYFKSLPPPYAIVGMGVTGQSLVRLLKALGATDSQIHCFDQQATENIISSPEALLKKNPKTFFVSPGVPLNTDWILKAKAQGALISSELSLSFSLLTSEQVIAITGSIGKSTTTSLLGVGAKELSPLCFVGGNLGTPLADYATEIVNQKRLPAPWIILELSSYQLENFENLNCDLSCITYLTPNHMERYSELSEYYNVKLRILEKTKVACVLNSLGGELKSYFETTQKPKLKPQIVWTDRDSSVALSPGSLIGEYNKDNLALAAKIAQLAKWPESSFLAMKSFRGLPHRLENVATIKSIRFINDSKATTIDSVIQATQTVLETLSENSRLHLLLGGHDKNLPWDRLKIFSNTPKLHCIFFGEFGASAQKITGLSGPCYKTLSLALKELPSFTHAGETVLLSPGGTSHDEFKNFEERGNFFKSEILKRWSN